MPPAVQSPATPLDNISHSQSNAQGPSSLSVQPASGHPAPAKSARGNSGSSSETATWKSESDETVKTRKNALRVIVSKFRNFWPADDDTRLGERAAELERGVYETTNSKTDYISRLQRDLGVLGQKKEVEKKTQRNIMQSSGDVFASLERDDKPVYQMSADAKAKFGQKVHSMEKKHQQLFVLLKQTDDRMKTNPEQQMKQIMTNFKNLCAMKDKGPYDVEQLNQIDRQLDQYKQVMLQRARQGQSRESVDRQNDRTIQVGARALEKLRKLNKEKPFVLADLGWSMQDWIPTVKDPPELMTIKRERAPKRARLAGGTQEEGPKLSRNGEPDGGFLPSMRPFRSKRGDCVPSVRESHCSIYSSALRGKGFIDLDVPNDGDHDASAADCGGAMPTSVEAVLEQLHHLLQSLQHDSLLPSQQEEAGSDVYEIKQKKPSRSGDGNLRLHTITVTLRRHDPPGTLIPWDARTECLRRLPLDISIKPDCLQNDTLFSNLMAQGRSLPPGEWLRSILTSVSTYLSCLHTVWTEIMQLKEAHKDYLNATVVRAGINDHGVCAEMTFSCIKWGDQALSILPRLEVLFPPDYPGQQPTYRLVDLKHGLASATAFSDHLALNMSNSAAPLGFTNIVECWLDACWSALDPS